jgi:hypothetical protein
MLVPKKTKIFAIELGAGPREFVLVSPTLLVGTDDELQVTYKSTGPVIY